MELSKTLIEQSSVTNDIVIDPFFGSGSVGEAALQAKRSFIGTDISDNAIKLARNRLNNINLAKELSLLELLTLHNNDVELTKLTPQFDLQLA